jgi:hypothetical protein
MNNDKTYQASELLEIVRDEQFRLCIEETYPLGTVDIVPLLRETDIRNGLVKIIKEYIKSQENCDTHLFDAFYAAYPKHIAVGEARKAFKSQNINEKTLEKILSAIIVQRANGTLDKDNQYTPHPASWIRGRRWLDDGDESKTEGVIKWI